MTIGKYWNEKIETMPVDELRKHQLIKLKEQVKHCYDHSAFYRKKLKNAGLKPENIKTLEDIQKIPFTVKDDLRDNYPFGMITVEPTDIVEIHASSGTTGNPIIGAYTTKKRGRNTRRLWLRPIHRRIRLPLRRSENWNNDSSRKRRNDTETDKTHEGSGCYSAVLHSELRSLSC